MKKEFENKLTIKKIAANFDSVAKKITEANVSTKEIGEILNKIDSEKASLVIAIENTQDETYTQPPIGNLRNDPHPGVL